VNTKRVIAVNRRSQRAEITNFDHNTPALQTFRSHFQATLLYSLFQAVHKPPVGGKYSNYTGSAQSVAKIIVFVLWWR